MTKDEQETLTRYFMQREREGNARDEDGPAVLLNGVNREFTEILEKLAKTFGELPTIGFKEHFVKTLDAVLEFGESVARMTTAPAGNLDKHKAMATMGKERLNEILNGKR
ncbi:MAG: hypothetical protein HUK20_11760 [Fibrobacter sp.]|nr:hypothetical protein [Fibrobacter sp.]